MKLSLSLENYLEIIYELSVGNNGVRITDLASKMNVSKASANKAVNNLSTLGYIINEKYQQIFMTKLGIEVSENLRKKHETIARFLIKTLNVDPFLADSEACKIEHIVDDELVKEMKNFLNKKE